MEQAAEPSYTGRFRAAVIGHTGRGDYGHGLDTVFVGLPGVEVVAVADPDEAGRQRVVALTGAQQGYADYREMLERERPDLVAVAPRRPDQHEAMCLAAARAGAKAIYCEKPFARALDEADRILATCADRGVKVAVAHQNRAFPAPRLARQLIALGRIGRLRAIRTYGKQDRRGGGQDLIVLGSHMIDLMRSLAGDARWCHARVLDGGEDATPAAVRAGEEAVGLVAGDDIVAEYGFDHGVTGSYESVRVDDDLQGNYFRMELCGTRGILVLWSGAESPVYFHPRPFALPDRAADWERLQPEPLPWPPGTSPGMSGMHAANQALVRHLLATVHTDQQPLSSGHDARATLEMILAVYESHFQGGCVSLPLTRREHPLARWT